MGGDEGGFATIALGKPERPGLLPSGSTLRVADPWAPCFQRRACSAFLYPFGFQVKCLFSNRLVPPGRTSARSGENPGSVGGTSGKRQVWGVGQHQHWAWGTMRGRDLTRSCLCLPSGLLLETLSQWVAVPRPLWCSVTLLSRTILTSRTLDTSTLK